MAAKSPARRLLLLLLVAALVAGGAVGFVRRGAKLVHAVEQLDVVSLVLAALFALLGVGAMLASWAVAVRDSGVELPTRDLVRIYCVGQVGKYVPGSIWPVVTQARLARRRGASPLLVASASLVNVVVCVAVFLSVGSLLLPFAGAHQVAWVQLAPVLAVPLLAVLHPTVLNALTGLAAKVLKRDPTTIVFTRREVLRSAGWAIVGSVLMGAHLYVLAHTLGVSGVRGFVLAVCGSALATGLGVASVFAPAGAGVREVVLAAVLAPVLSVDSAVVLALASRAVFVVVDLGLGASQVLGLRHWPSADEADDRTV